MENLKSQISKLPQDPGIYEFLDEIGILLYVGKSVSIKKRVASYFSKKDLGPKTNLLVSKIKKIKYIKVFSEFEALLLESELIRTHKPFFNIIAKDDKSPIYIKITGGPISSKRGPRLPAVGEASDNSAKRESEDHGLRPWESIPLISVTRYQKPQTGVFLKGPFPSSKITKSILKNIRKIFPYCQHSRPQKPCLYVHLGLCPYPYAGDFSAERYKKDIVKIKKLLSGQIKSLIRDLNKEMKNYSQKQEFEQAQAVKIQIESLNYLTQTYQTPREFLEQPTLVDDLNLIRLKDFQKVLSLNKLPKRIECYDISNISGKNAAGSQIVFTNGRPDKSQYRRFKIKSLSTPNDFAMLKEVIKRRLKNDWPIPDVMIIDGGRGQLNAVYSAIPKPKYTFKLVSLAKRLEEIYTLQNSSPIRLPKESPARQLAQAIRDEAHRFAITYHRKLRSKNFLISQNS